MNLEMKQSCSPDIIKHIVPHLIITDPEMRDLYVGELAAAILKAPESLLILTAFDETDKDLRVFLIAQDPGMLYPFANVSQLWSHPDNPRSWADPFFARTILWAVSRGKKYLRAETPRNLGAMYRRFGFESYLQVIKFDLVKSGHYDLLTQHPEEVLDVRILRT